MTENNNKSDFETDLGLVTVEHRELQGNLFCLQEQQADHLERKTNQPQIAF